jgi:predicted acetyltransferase
MKKICSAPISAFTRERQNHARERPKTLLRIQAPALTQLKYRKATAKDSQLLGELNHQLIRDHHLPHYLDVSQLTRRMRKWLASDHRAVIFTLDGDMVAYALYRQTSDHVFLRQFLVVHGERRKGLGRQAFNILNTQIWPKTIKRTVECLNTNKAATSFWLNLGFRIYSLKLELSPICKKTFLQPTIIRNYSTKAPEKLIFHPIKYWRGVIGH